MNVSFVSQVSAADLERLMVRLPAMFRQELSGVGANLEKRWKFCGFDSLGSAWCEENTHTQWTLNTVCVCVHQGGAQQPLCETLDREVDGTTGPGPPYGAGSLQVSDWDPGLWHQSRKHQVTKCVTHSNLWHDGNSDHMTGFITGTERRNRT